MDFCAALVSKMQLNAGHKEEVPLKPATSPEFVSLLSDAQPVQPMDDTRTSEQAPAGCSRGTRTSATMLGLALTVSTSGTLLMGMGDGIAADASALDRLPAIEKAPVLPSVGSGQVSGSSVIYHTVADGETLWDIARLHQSKVEDIKAANGIDDEPLIQAGQVIKVPTTPVVRSVAQPPSRAASPTEAPQALGPAMAATPEASSVDVAAIWENSHEFDFSSENLSAGEPVLPELGDSAIASPLASDDMAAGTPVQAGTPIATAQGEGVEPTASNPDAIHAPAADGSVPVAPTGDSFQVAIAPSEPTAVVETGVPQIAARSEQAPPTPSRYRVRRGDTLSSIARQHGVSLEALAEANRITNPNRIFVGTVLVLPATPLAESQGVTVATAPPSVQVAAAEPVALSAPRVNANRLSLPQEDDAPTAQAVTGDVASAIAPTGVGAVPDPEADPYVSNLLSRVQAVQARQQSVPERLAQVNREQEDLTTAPPANPAPVVIASSPTVTDAVTGQDGLSSGLAAHPDLTPSTSSDSDRSEFGQRELLAAAPLGSEVYAPINSSPVGQVVSPSLPILPDSSEYLPDAPARFSGYIWPAQGVLTSGYGWRWGRMHRGLDIAGPVGTPIVAAAAGVVVRSGWNSGGYGNMVDIRHPDGSLTRYAHHHRNLVEVGQQVRQGQQIAEMGSTGRSTGPHLHFEVHIPDTGTVNPMAHLPSR